MFSVHERSYYEHCENGTHLGLRSMTYCVYTAQRVRSFWCALSVLIAVCVLSPAHLEHCSQYTSVHTCFGCVLRGRFVPRTWFDHVPAGTVLAGTILFRTRSDYKKWCVPRTCSHVPAGTVPRTSMNARFVNSSRHTYQHVDSDPYHKAWLFNPKLHQKLMVKGVSLSWVPSSGTLFPPGYGLCQTYHHLRNTWRRTFISNNSQYLQSVWTYHSFLLLGSA